MTARRVEHSIGGDTSALASAVSATKTELAIECLARADISEAAGWWGMGAEQQSILGGRIAAWDCATRQSGYSTVMEEAWRWKAVRWWSGGP